MSKPTYLIIAILIILAAGSYLILRQQSTPVIDSTQQQSTTTGSTSTASTSTTSTSTVTRQKPPTTSSTSTDWKSDMQVVTSQDFDKTFYFKKNERFLIQLGSGLRWQLTFDPAGIISRVPNSTTENSIQGIYQADQPGMTTLRAAGSPICSLHEMCPQFIRSVTATLIVQQ